MNIRLSIITINYNNASGLQKTMESVSAQTSKEFEYIVIDGGSFDKSIDIIKKFESSKVQKYSWISENDNGIYQAMNKGIKMAKGDYLQFLNSGDILASSDVTEKMLNNLENQIPKTNSQESKTENSKNQSECSNQNVIEILYGNMLKPYKGKIIRDKGFAGRMPTMIDFYTGTLNHSSAYIKRSLFETYGLYDETLKIVSDWKWYLQVIALGGVTPVYVDIDVSVFDMNGISNVNSELDKAERRKVLEELVSSSVLTDYDNYAFLINQIKRINRYWLTRKGFWLIERILFKWEKWFKNMEQVL
jgi:glycosyltransferase involved in cell wall biosynthesis